MEKETVKYLIKKTLSNYSSIAADFDRTRGFSWRIMQEFAKFVKPGDVVLDFGCGNGRLLDSLEIENIVYKGVDPVPEFINIARQKYQDVTAFDQSARGLAIKTKRSMEFKVMDFDVDDFKIDFPDKYFNHIFAIAVFHHLPSRELRKNVLKEFKRILKDDGCIFISVWNLWQGKHLFEILKFFLMKISGKIIGGRFLRGWYDGVSVADLDSGDLFIDYTTTDKNIVVRRYHHAFCKKGISDM
ncbi:hypothetical protein A2907_01575, partial [Candidatus Azambacteria bacterium RIFCSPLOWO2_01_FULL_37_9]